MTKYLVTIDQDIAGNTVLPLPAELFEGDHPWLIGDTLEWKISDTNEVTLINKSWLERNK